MKEINFVHIQFIQQKNITISETGLEISCNLRVLKTSFKFCYYGMEALAYSVAPSIYKYLSNYEAYDDIVCTLWNFNMKTKKWDVYKLNYLFVTIWMNIG